MDGLAGLLLELEAERGILAICLLLLLLLLFRFADVVAAELSLSLLDLVAVRVLRLLFEAAAAVEDGAPTAFSGDCVKSITGGIFDVRWMRLR